MHAHVSGAPRLGLKSARSSTCLTFLSLALNKPLCSYFIVCAGNWRESLGTSFHCAGDLFIYLFSRMPARDKKQQVDCRKHVTVTTKPQAAISLLILILAENPDNNYITEHTWNIYKNKNMKFCYR